MRPPAPPSPYRAADLAMVRTVASSLSAAPDWPDVTRPAPDQVAESTGWLRAAWADEDLAEALSLASPTLARQVEQLCQEDVPNAREVRRAVLATGRYLLRAAGRPTPFGFFAGVQAASFTPAAAVSWGRRNRPVVRAAAGWLAEVISQLENCPMLLAQLEVVANNRGHCAAYRRSVVRRRRRSRTGPVRDASGEAGGFLPQYSAPAHHSSANRAGRQPRPDHESARPGNRTGRPRPPPVRAGHGGSREHRRGHRLGSRSAFAPRRPPRAQPHSQPSRPSPRNGDRRPSSRETARARGRPAPGRRPGAARGSGPRGRARRRTACPRQCLPLRRGGVA